MSRRVVIAIDVDLSPHTQHMLCVASSLLERTSPQVDAVLLHVIPVPDIPQSKFSLARMAPTARQRELAKRVLHRARLAIFTASETARMFAPPQRAAGRKAVAAATAALEQLACRGVLVCQKINGELRCIND